LSSIIFQQGQNMTTNKSKRGNKTKRRRNKTNGHPTRKGIYLSTRGKLFISAKRSGPVSVRGHSGRKIWEIKGRAPDMLRIKGSAKLINGSNPSVVTLEAFGVRFRTQVLGYESGTLLVLAKPMYAALARGAFKETALNYYIG
jgi:hypothetical protein